jgi:hypothetical protein
MTDSANDMCAKCQMIREVHGAGGQCVHGVGFFTSRLMTTPPLSEHPESAPRHTHTCLRCGLAFPCQSLGVCVANPDVLPRIVLGIHTIIDHCTVEFEHRGYRGRGVYDFDSHVYFGTVADVRDVVTFESPTFEGVEAAFRDSVDAYLGMLPPVSAPSNTTDARPTNGYPCCGGVMGHNAWCASLAPVSAPSDGTPERKRVAEALSRAADRTERVARELRSGPESDDELTNEILEDAKILRALAEPVAETNATYVRTACKHGYIMPCPICDPKYVLTITPVTDAQQAPGAPALSGDSGIEAIAARLLEAITARCDAAFNAAEWNRDDEDETYEDVMARVLSADEEATAAIDAVLTHLRESREREQLWKAAHERDVAEWKRIATESTARADEMAQAHAASFGALAGVALLVNMDDVDDYGDVVKAVEALAARADAAEADTKRLDWLEANKSDVKHRNAIGRTPASWAVDLDPRFPEYIGEGVTLRGAIDDAIPPQPQVCYPFGHPDDRSSSPSPSGSNGGDSV